MPAPTTREDLLRLQREVLELVATGTDVEIVLDNLCRAVERRLDHAVCVVTKRDDDVLRLVSAPSIPREAFDAIATIDIAPKNGSCVTAVLTGEAWTATDIATDPCWENLRPIGDTLGVKSSASQPIRSRGNTILGTICIAWFERFAPTDEELELLEMAGHVAGIALDRERVDRELREQRSLLQAMIDGSEDPMFIKDRDGRYELLNAAGATALGRSVAGVIGRRDREFFPPAIAARIEASDSSVLSTGRSTMSEIEMPDAARGDRVHLVHKSPRRDADGNTIGVIGVIRDITELRRDEHVRRESLKLESLAVLTAGLAHEFNNLLTSILGNVELAQDTLSEPRAVRSNLDAIETAARRAAELTDTMVAYSGQRARRSSTVDPRQCVRTAVADLQGSIRDRIQVQCTFDEAVAFVAGDRSQIAQVVSHLLKNAIESFDQRDSASTNPGQIGVSVSTRVVDEAELGTLCLGPRRLPGDYVVIQVEDDGCGMAQDTIDRAFDPFFSTKFAGRGLGLAAVRGIVSSHGGAIGIDSADDRGTVVRVYLPALRD